MGKAEIIFVLDVRPEDRAFALRRNRFGERQKKAPGGGQPAVIGRGDFVQSRLEPVAGQARIDGLQPQGEGGGGGGERGRHQAARFLPAGSRQVIAYNRIILHRHRPMPQAT